MINKPYIIGLTGGIASGKSSVASLFSNLGIPSVDLDDVARLAVQPNTPALKALADKFGSNILTQDGNLDRVKLRQIIFTDAEAKHWVEQLLHPIIKQEAFNQIHKLKTKAPYTLLVAPLLFETGLEQKVNHTLVIDTNETQQIIRIMERDQISAEAAQNIMSQQMRRELRLAKADTILENNGGLENLKAAVFSAHEKLAKLGQHHKKSHKPIGFQGIRH